MRHMSNVWCLATMAGRMEEDGGAFQVGMRHNDGSSTPTPTTLSMETYLYLLLFHSLFSPILVLSCPVHLPSFIHPQSSLYSFITFFFFFSSFYTTKTLT